MILLFNQGKNIFKMQVIFICWNLIKGKQFYTLLPPFNMNKLKNFNLVYKIKKAKTVKIGAVDRL